MSTIMFATTPSPGRLFHDNRCTVLVGMALLLIAACEEKNKSAFDDGAGGAGGEGVGGGARGGRDAAGGQSQPPDAGESGGQGGLMPPAPAGRGGEASGMASCEPPRLELTLVADSRGSTPIMLAQPAGDPRLFVAQRNGTIVVLRDGQLATTPFLDIRASIAPLETERGLLGMAFHPQYPQNGRFFLLYTRRGTDPMSMGQPGDIVIAEGQASSANPDRAQATVKPLVVIGHSRARFHNGGMLAFGPDGMLYASIGDYGGFVGDDNSRDLRSPLGKLLRLDPDRPAEAPAGNIEGGHPLVWGYGLRNPWRFSFDRMTGDLYVGDVQEKRWEEVTYVPADYPSPRDFGWPVLEGDACFPVGKACDKVGILPVATYFHDGGGSDPERGCVNDPDNDKPCSRAVVGGYVYRGRAIPALRGRYIYGDNITNQVFSFVTRDGKATCAAELTQDLTSNATPIQGLASFAEDADGELYVLNMLGRIYRIERE